MLGRRARLVDQSPPIDKLPENNARQGFFKLADLERVIAHLPANKGANVYLPPLLRFAYPSGWRKSEMIGLQWRAVDFEAAPFASPPARRRTISRASARSRPRFAPCSRRNGPTPIR